MADYGDDPIEVFEDAGKAMLRLAVVLACLIVAASFCGGALFGAFVLQVCK